MYLSGVMFRVEIPASTPTGKDEPIYETTVQLENEQIGLRHAIEAAKEYEQELGRKVSIVRYQVQSDTVKGWR